MITTCLMGPAEASLACAFAAGRAPSGAAITAIVTESATPNVHANLNPLRPVRFMWASPPCSRPCRRVGVPGRTRLAHLVHLASHEGAQVRVPRVIGHVSQLVWV